MAVTTIRDPKTKKVKAFRVEVYSAGVVIADRLFDAKVYTKSSAYLWQDEMKAKASKGFVINKTFAEVLDDYERGPFQRKRQTTQQAKMYIIARYLRPSPLARLRMDEIAPAHITHWLNWMKSLPGKSARRFDFFQEVVFLKKIFSWYRDTSDLGFVIPISPLHRTEESKYRNKPERRPDYYIPPEEVRAWLAAMEARKKRLYFIFGSVMVHLGLRVSECAALEWPNVELDGPAPVIKIHDSLAWDRRRGNRPYWQGATKNKSSMREIRIPKVLVELLRELKNQGTHSIMWPDFDGTIRERRPVFLTSKMRPLCDQRIRYHFNSGFERIGVKWSGTHIARHTFGTLSLVATRDLSATQATMGHKKPGQTMEYAKVIALRFGDQIQKTADLIAEGDLKITHRFTHSGGENEKTPAGTGV